MRIWFALLFILPSVLLSSQELPVFYYNSDMAPLAKASYMERVDDDAFLCMSYELDTMIVAIAFDKVVEGKLSSEEHKRIKTYSKLVTKETLKDDQVLVINYFYYQTPSDYDDIFYYEGTEIMFDLYLKALGRLGNVYQFFVGPTSFDERTINGFYLFGDRSRFLGQKFFKTYIRIGSYLIVYPDGSYTRVLGEFGTNQIPKQIKAYNKAQKVLAKKK